MASESTAQTQMRRQIWQDYSNIMRCSIANTGHLQYNHCVRHARVPCTAWGGEWNNTQNNHTDRYAEIHENEGIFEHVRHSSAWCVLGEQLFPEMYENIQLTRALKRRRKGEKNMTMWEGRTKMNKISDNCWMSEWVLRGSHGARLSNTWPLPRHTCLIGEWPNVNRNQ